METTFNIPKYYKVAAYQINPQTGYFEKSAKQPDAMPCDVMPYQLKREQTRAAQIVCNADECLTLNERKKGSGSKVIFTGLQPTIYHHWHIGNHYRMSKGNKILSDILFYFHPDNDRMIAFYFTGFHKDTKELRAQFAATVIPFLTEKYGL